MNSPSNSSEPELCFQIPTLETITSPIGQFCLILLYSSTAFLSFFGNLIVLIVQIFGKRSLPTMRKYLSNLAISDLAMGVLCVPFTYTDFVYRRWIFPEWLCGTSQFVQLLTVFVTAFTLTNIGIERYMATLHPLSGCYKWLQSHSGTLLCLSWLLGAFYAFIPLMHTHTRQFTVNETTYYECAYQNGWSSEQQNAFMATNFLLTFAIPAFVLTFAYTAIIRKFCRITRQRKSNELKNGEVNGVMAISSSKQLCPLTEPVNSCKSHYHQHHQLHQLGPPYTKRKIAGAYCSTVVNRRTIRVGNRALTIRLLIVVVMYILCWSPIKLFQLLSIYQLFPFCTESQLYTYIYLYIGCHWLAMANCFVNPLIYSWMSNGFRRDLRRILQTTALYVWEKLQLHSSESTSDAAL